MGTVDREGAPPGCTRRSLPASAPESAADHMPEISSTQPPKTLALIGATGSIGQSALDVVRQYPGRFCATFLASGGNAEKLARAVRAFRPVCAGIADVSKYSELKALLAGTSTRLIAGDAEIEAYLRTRPAQMCLSAASGSAGLGATLAALDAKMDIALANKESLVTAGALIMPRVKEAGIRLLPVDSEHSALFQCLQGAGGKEVRKYIITASGGAFRDFTAQELQSVTPQQALAHPTWSMGPKITVDSATLANKALEVIEAHWLFNAPYEKIEVLVHRQSAVHGMVEFCDGSLLAQLALPDMRLPILHAFAWPERLAGQLPGLSLARLRELTFEEPDHERFPMLRLGLAAGKAGGLAPAVYSAANEEAVHAFLAGCLPYPAICGCVEDALSRIACGDARNIPTLPEILAADQESRRIVRTAAAHGGIVR